ncbi:patatin-like phospholipase family protein [Oceanisphaera arctica]|uniref:Serine protease n=1 Tax=Oceanisphaera arctica TaxID=641510 RepID=A0A2P5TJN9_9GAMM|nr:patatin-like phospholipase family protein [Oceanisphaera arctica]PPL15198.1 serine protease [Oceanisphaera arctica]GHA04153.1 serine protease [Oceanisphaera arctica]
MRPYLLPLLLLLSSFSAHSQDTDQTRAERPRIALVLSGGGAKGAAHIGVIKMLEQQRIPIDIVTGTSMGAYVAGMYALGLDATELEQQLLRLDWNQGYQDKVGRDELSLRRKRQNDEFLLRTDIGIDQNWQLNLPGGFFQGQAMGALLRKSTLNLPGLHSFDDLPIPFRAVATDMETVTPVVLKEGHLATAMQASMSVPGVLQPVEIDERLLADGGVVNNMPVDVARELGADIIIAVDIGDAMLSRKQLDGALAMVSQLTNYLTRSSTERQIALMSADDILITPAIGGIGVGDFELMPEAILRGEKAALALLPRLQGLVLSEEDYYAYQSDKLDRRAQLQRSDAVYLDRIEVKNRSKLSEKVVRDVLGVVPGQFHQTEDLEDGVRRLYALDAFERVSYRIEEDEGEQVLTVQTSEKGWGPGFVDLKFALEDDFSNRSNYEIGAQFRRTNFNMLGGEWLVETTFGSNKQLATEIYTPIVTDYDAFWKLRGEYEQRRRSFFFDPNDPQSELFRPLTNLEFDYSTWSLNSELGYNLRPWSELALGVQGLLGDIETRNIDRRLKVDSVGPYLRFNYDTLDNVFFPTHGEAVELQLGYYRNGLEFDGGRESITGLDYELEWLRPYQHDRHTFIGKLSFGGSSAEQDVPVFARSLGGLFNLSGYQRDQLNGRYSGFGGLLYHYRWFDNDFGAFRSPVYLGGSLERGGVWNAGAEVSWESALTAGSVFIGVDTNWGPLYLAYGLGEGDKSSVYLYFGNLFSF